MRHPGIAWPLSGQRCAQTIVAASEALTFGRVHSRGTLTSEARLSAMKKYVKFVLAMARMVPAPIDRATFRIAVIHRDQRA
ncbi:MAG: hypothetical protein AB1938_08815 [Myxococcota bacterium]